jgi:hypothetical protein
VRHLAGLTDTLGDIATRPGERDAVRAFKARIDASDPPAERHLKSIEPAAADAGPDESEGGASPT